MYKYEEWSSHVLFKVIWHVPLYKPPAQIYRLPAQINRLPVQINRLPAQIS